jgi:tRNA-dihydrouridine synthase A
MQDAVSVPVTVKHRIGIDRGEDYGFVRDFVGALFEAGCRVFIVHARNAWLKGLSPKENREVPPLRYDVVVQLKRDFPAATVVLNGGLLTLAQAQAELVRADGVMLGRAAYHDPHLLAAVDCELFGDPRPAPTRGQVVARMSTYLSQTIQQGVAPRNVLRHVLGLYHGQRAARRWRQLLSDPAFIAREGSRALETAQRVFDTAGPVAVHP